MADNETPDSMKSNLQLEIERLTRANAALVSEFSTGSTESVKETPEKVREELGKGVLNAVQMLKNLAETAESESVRASCSKYLIDLKLGRFDKTNSDDSDLKKLLEELKA